MPEHGNESTRERDERIERLWELLDTRKEGQIDLRGFKKGLKQIDHPLKNADDLLHDILKAIDTSQDGRIQYSEFRSFVQQAEQQLWQLFQAIDHDRNGHLDKTELKDAFSRAGMSVPNSKLDQFFEDVDTNRDGVISFDEWRDFLLFLPDTHNLRSVISYYSATGTLNPEGDVHINKTLQGSGTAPHLSPTTPCTAEPVPVISPPHARPAPVPPPPPPLDPDQHQYYMFAPPYNDHHEIDQGLEVEFLIVPSLVRIWLSYRYLEEVLTESTPHVGYFLAGGMAGVVSRTATAPFDRLKVYLIAQTNTSSAKSAAVNAVKAGAPVKAVGWMSWPIVEATKELWRAGGIRSLFAGNGLNVVKVMPESAIKFGAYEASKRFFANLEGHDDTKNLLPISQFLSGGIGGMISQCCVYPLDTLKFRMQCETVQGGLHGNQLIYSTASKMWQTNGLTGYFRGLPLGLLGMFPFAAIDLMTFEYLKSTLVARNARLAHCHESDVQLNNFSTGAIGAFSGALSASIVYPLNVLRTRLQAQGTVLHKATYTGIVDVTVRTVRSEGVYGLFRGLTPNLLKVVPSVSISYIVYENSKRLFGLS
ncbi:uncharacterized protein GIQ15_04981 [Arthroderma uncinatum]|uniref:uncharacterized protein n=1 Tax=Arthroderma uncinatum TaxID=74035 RepID=UPI00144ADB63|nr:uncharacterized protein GIQ15_04981 [Arthroderma uncinatum]KAF3482222.1 hypothetical protein GIQ15_04981 [Arthroderma uncinatum]